jgi:hypothetical protein
MIVRTMALISARNGPSVDFAGHPPSAIPGGPHFSGDSREITVNAKWWKLWSVAHHRRDQAGDAVGNRDERACAENPANVTLPRHGQFSPGGAVKVGLDDLRPRIEPGVRSGANSREKLERL